MKREIKAIIFDVGGVLALGKKSVWKNGKLVSQGVHLDVSKEINISLDQYLDAIDTAYAKSIEKKISKKKTIEIFSKNLKISQKKLKKIYLQAYKRNFKQNKKLFKQAFKFKKQCYKIAVLSDQWPLSKEALMSEKLYKKFDEVIVSCEVGLRKPNLEIYKLLLKKIKIPAKNCLFIDNQEWNIKPAKKLGIQTILFKDNKQLFFEFKKIGLK